MSDREIRKSFVVAASIERVWKAFTDPGERMKWYAPHFEIEPRAGGRTRYVIGDFPPVEGTVEEINAPRVLRQTEEAGILPGDTTIAITFEAVDGGTRVEIVQAGFGTSDEWGDSLEGHALGWAQGIADLILYLEHGVVADRFFTPWRTSLGFAVAEIAGGLRVTAVQPGGYADEAGLRVGDLPLRIGGVPVYTRADLWSIQFAHGAGEPLRAEFGRDGVRLEGTAPLRPMPVGVA